jgi:phage gp29-like protein
MGITSTLKNLYTAAVSPKQSKRNVLAKRVTQAQINLLRQDIGKWRSAQVSAKDLRSPDREMLYNLYADLLIDSHLTSLMQTRKINVLGKPFKVVNDSGVEDKEKTKLFQAPWFRQFLSHAMDSKFWGHSLIEFGDLVEGQFQEVYLVPRANVSPELGIVKENVDGSGQVFSYHDAADLWVIEVGEQRDLGLLEKAAPHVLWKKAAAAAWSEYCEVFGMPVRVGKTDTDDPIDRANFERMLRDLGSAAYAMLANDESIEFIQNPQSDAYMVYDQRIERSNSEMSKLILGQTMTSDNGSSRSQSEVHERVAQSYTSDDMRHMSDVINFKLIPFLIERGYPLQGFYFEWDTSEVLGIKEQWDIIDKAMQRGLKVPADYITQTFGFPLVIEEEENGAINDRPILGYHIETGVVKKNEARAQLGLAAEDDAEDEAQRKLVSKLAVMKAARDAGISPQQAAALAGLDITVETEATTEPNFNKPQSGKQAQIGAVSRLTAFYSGVHSCSHHTAAFEADKELEKEINRLIDEIHTAGVAPEMDEGLFNRIYAILSDAVSIGYGAADPEQVTYLLSNVQVFSAFKTYQQLRAFSDLLVKEDGTLRMFSEFKKEALKVHEQYNVNWLRTEYNQSVASSQMASKWNGYQADALLRYDTVGDGRVRNEHKMYDQIILPKDHEFWNTHYPPNDWGCRCNVIETDPDDSVSDPNDYINLPAPVNFAGNVGKTGTIFPESHPYFDVAEEVKERIYMYVNRA